MKIEHEQLAAGKWAKLTLVEQMANVGSEVGRAISWREKGNWDYSQRAFERALELLDLTISDEKNKTRLREIVRTREVLVDYFQFKNVYQSTKKSWENYFTAFNFAAKVSH